MRHVALVTLLVAAACGRSVWGTRGDAGAAGGHPFEREASADEPAPVMDASIDRPGDAVEADSACGYQVGERFVLSCCGGYALVTEMFDGWDGCPRYFVYESTQRAYAQLSDLLSENDCASSCRWETSLWEVVDCSGGMDRMTETSIAGYADPFRSCPIATVWFSNVTGQFYADHDEARATLPVCIDGGSGR